MQCIDPQPFLEADEIGYDSETRDPNLLDKGPGCYRKDGYIVGVSFATKDVSEYYPIAHPDTSQEEREKNLHIIKAVLEKNNAKVGANIIYDCDWAQNSNLLVNGPLHDVQYAEPLLDEYMQSYSLAALAEKYGEEEKATELLKKACVRYGFDEKNPYNHIWELPSEEVQYYARLDGSLALNIFQKQKKVIEEQGLSTVYDIERRLLPLLLQMRKQGVRLDTKLLAHTSISVEDKRKEFEQKIYNIAGHEFNIGSTMQLAKVFDTLGIKYPRKESTELMKERGKEGNPTLDKNFLKSIKDSVPLATLILNYRHYDTLVNMFFIPYMEMLVNGRLHGQFHPNRSDTYGTVSGRFSSSKPNLQQVPAQDDDGEGDDNLKGRIIRKLFIPEKDCKWAKLDYSQVEYRVTAHYAIGPGADELRKDYNDNPDTDYHKRIQDLTGLPRRECKRLNFGASYGMGIKSAAKNFGWTLEEAEMFMDLYHAKAPYLRATREIVLQTAERRGYIYTLLGRRARVNPSRKLHSFFNRLIQGSAADIMKAALVQSYEKGLFKVLMPHITVHDEIDVSVPQTKEGEEALKELKYTMEHAIELKVPLRADCHVADNWADAD